MKIRELINNNFSFNVKYRIYEYQPLDKEEGKSILKYDSEGDIEYSLELDDKDITAINQSEDGVLEIEYVE